MTEKLKQLLKNSYSPYSNFKVASIVVMKDDKEFSGVNVENASYGAGICAERSAILAAISSGYKKHDFKKMYVMCDSDIIATSCFLCRQVMLELFEKDVNVVAMNKDGDELILTVEELCPFPFDEDNLK